MPLTLTASNSLEDLAARLAENLRLEHKGVFTPYTVVTQTEGMNNWLKLRLSEHLGIAAHIRFLKTNDLIFELYRSLGGRSRETLPKQGVVWILYGLLDDPEFRQRFPHRAAYFSHDPHQRDIRRMGLAEKMADLFDQYQIYRPEMIRKWNRSNLSELGRDDWQVYLWLKGRTAARKQVPDKTLVRDFILDALRQGQAGAPLQRDLPEVHLFGLSILTAYHIEVLLEVARHINVRFYIVNPAPETYWFDDRSEKDLARHRAGSDHLTGNSLLLNWGKVLKDTFRMFFRQSEDFLNSYETAGVAEPEPDTLLHKIQNDIYNNHTDTRNTLSAQDLTDGSLTIHSCHTPAREAETIYNYLIHLHVHRKTVYTPRDVVVLCTDIDRYSPYIKAVFDHAPFRIPYVIADERVSGGDTIQQALASVMQLTESGFTSEQVVQLLDCEPVRKRFRITNISRIREVVEAAGIRFGISGTSEDDTFLVSWQYGIRRIMYGICMEGGSLYEDGTTAFYPLDIVEGSETEEIIRFCHFAEVLASGIEARKTARRAADWVLYTERIILDLIHEPEEEVNEDYSRLILLLKQYADAASYTDEKISYEVFAHSFLQMLDSDTRAGLFAGNGVTFCSMIPMRSIPFRIVAMMGLNYDAFPRKEKPSGFNLIAQEPRPGDRNIRENDKHLFLETLLSAKDYLYISYNGNSPKDNADLPPSAVLDELIDYISSGSGQDDETIRRILVRKQPLHAFGTRSVPEHSIPNYLSAGTPILPQIIRAGEDRVEEISADQITLHDLTSFFKNPVRTYYHKTLEIRYEQDNILLPEHELFDLDPLQEWHLKQLILQSGKTPDTLQRELLLSGRLPLKNMSERAIQILSESVLPARALFEEATKGTTPHSLDFEFSFGHKMVHPYMLAGQLDNIYDDSIIMISWSGNELRQLSEAYIRYLCAIAAGAAKRMIFISAKARQKAFHTPETPPLTPARAKELLEDLTLIYIDGLKNKNAFFPGLAMKEQELSELDTEKLNRIVQDQLSRHADEGDPYIALAYEQGVYSRPESAREFKDIYRAVIAPIDQAFPEYFKQND